MESSSIYSTQTKIEVSNEAASMVQLMWRVEELGMNLKYPCPSLDRVDIDFPDREDFQGLVL